MRLEGETSTSAGKSPLCAYPGAWMLIWVLAASVEDAVGRRGRVGAQTPRGPLGLVAVEQRRRRSAAAGTAGQLPCQVDGIANTCVHACAPYRAVDVRRVAKEKRPSVAELVRDAVVHSIGREPVDSRDVDVKLSQRAVADIAQRSTWPLGRALIAHGADEVGCVPRTREGKDREEGQHSSEVNACSFRPAGGNPRG